MIIDGTKTIEEFMKHVGTPIPENNTLVVTEVKNKSGVIIECTSDIQLRDILIDKHPDKWSRSNSTDFILQDAYSQEMYAKHIIPNFAKSWDMLMLVIDALEFEILEKENEVIQEEVSCCSYLIWQLGDMYCTSYIDEVFSEVVGILEKYLKHVKGSDVRLLAQYSDAFIDLYEVGEEDKTDWNFLIPIVEKVKNDPNINAPNDERWKELVSCILNDEAETVFNILVQFVKDSNGE